MHALLPSYTIRLYSEKASCLNAYNYYFYYLMIFFLCVCVEKTQLCQTQPTFQLLK